MVKGGANDEVGGGTGNDKVHGGAGTTKSGEAKETM